MTLTESHGHFVQKPVFDSIPRKGEMSHIIPRFFVQQVATDQLDSDTGLKVFRSVEYVELLIPGDKGNAAVKRVNDAIKQQFAVEYQRFKAQGEGADMVGDGIPLELWPSVNKDQVYGLKHANIFSVQQLASLSDERLSQPGLMGLRALRDKAVQYLQVLKEHAPIAALQKQIDDMKAQAVLRDKQLSDMIEVNSQLKGQSPGGAAETEPKLTTPRQARTNKE